MKSKETRYPGTIRLFKGLQRPLEVMGLQGRYIYWRQERQAEPSAAL